MLQQILKEMYIDPDVLEALNEDQKKTLFLKMRQEQVRRWQEREDRLEQEEADAVRRTKPKKANSKSVSWLLGRDGDVAVIVIGEVDELASKFICSGLGEKKSTASVENKTQSSTSNHSILVGRKTFEPNRTERGATPPQPNKAKCEDTSTLAPLSVSVREQTSLPSAGKQPESKAIEKVEEKPVAHSSLSPKPFVRTGAVVVRPATATTTPGSLSGSPAQAGAKRTAAPPTFSPISTTKLEPANSPKAPGTRETPSCQDVTRVTVRSASEDASSLGNGPPACAGRGRVAQLMKAFSPESTTGSPQSPGQAPTRGSKPPLPTKPSHLRSSATPSVR